MIEDAPDQRMADDDAEMADADAPQPSTREAEASGGEDSPLDALRREADECRDRLFRLAAELENVRKRAARDVENARKYGLERLAQALLPVRDSLEAGLAAAGCRLPSARSLFAQKPVAQPGWQTSADAMQRIQPIAAAPLPGEPFFQGLFERRDHLLVPLLASRCEQLQIGDKARGQ